MAFAILENGRHQGPKRVLTLFICPVEFCPMANAVDTLESVAPWTISMNVNALLMHMIACVPDSIGGLSEFLFVYPMRKHLTAYELLH
jgi:hypothetical protein